MAGGNVVEVIARVKADVSQAQQNFKALGDQFKNLKLGEGLTRNLEADFKNLEKSFSNYFEKLDVGATGKASVKELNNITSASQDLDKAIARLLADWEKIGERDLHRSLDLSGLEKDRKEVEDLANSLDTKLKTAMTALKEGGKNLNAAGLRDYGKALSDAAKAIKEGDLSAAGQKYNEVYEGLAKKIEEVNQEIKDTQNNAAKQQENLAGARANIKMYEDIRRAVNDAYGSDTRKQIEETMAVIQTSMGKGGVGGLGQKLQDKFGNLPEIQGQLKNFISMLQQPWKGNNIEEIGKQFTELRDKIKEVGGDSLARSFSQLIGPSTQANLKSQVESIKKDIQSLLPTFQQVSNSLSQGQIKDKFDQMVSSIAQGDIGALSNYMNTLGDAIAKVQKQVQAGGSDTTALEKELETLKNVQTAIGNAFGANSQQYISETSQKLKEFRESLDDTSLTNDRMVGDRIGKLIKLCLELCSLHTEHFDRFFFLCCGCITEFCPRKGCLNLSFSNLLRSFNRCRSQRITELITHNSQIGTNLVQSGKLFIQSLDHCYRHNKICQIHSIQNCYHNPFPGCRCM